MPKACSWNWRQLALPSPRVPAIVHHKSWQPAQGYSHGLTDKTIEPSVPQDDARQLHRQSLGAWQVPVGHNLPPPRQKLMVNINLHWANIRARSAQAAGVGQTVVMLRIARRSQDRSDRTRYCALVAEPAAPP